MHLAEINEVIKASPDLWDFQDWGTCDESHYYKQFGQSGIGVPSYNSGQSVSSQRSARVGNRSSLLQKRVI